MKRILVFNLKSSIIFAVLMSITLASENNKLGASK